MILKSYIFSYVSGNYQQYTSDHSEAFIKQCCIDCKDTHQIAIHRDGNLMYYAYLYKKNASSIYGFCVVCGEICLNLKWLFEYLQKTLEVSANKGVLFNYDKQGQICKNVVNFSSEAAEIDNVFRDIKKYLEMRPAYWEQVSPEDLSIPLTSRITFAFNDDKLKITEALRHYHNVIVTMENTIPSSFSQTVLRLNSEKEQLMIQKTELETKIELLKRQKKQYKWVIVLSLLVVVGLIAIISINQNINELHGVLSTRDISIDSLNNVVANKNQAISTRDNIISRKEKELNAAKSELNTVKGVLDSISSYMPFVVYELNVKNEGEEYGGTIYSKNTTYIYPKLETYGLTDGTIELFVKFYSPDGFQTYSESPPGYTYSDKVTLNKHQNNTLVLSGYGDKTKGNWKSGSYRIEIWYESRCLYEKKFTIY